MHTWLWPGEADTHVIDMPLSRRIAGLAHLDEHLSEDDEPELDLEAGANDLGAIELLESIALQQLGEIRTVTISLCQVVFNHLLDLLSRAAGMLDKIEQRVSYALNLIVHNVGRPPKRDRCRYPDRDDPFPPL
jgi:hypothetical protein